MASNNKAFVRDVKKFLKRNSMILVALFILVVALSIFTNTFLTKDNLLSVVRQCSVEAVLAFGMALVLIIGCIDLSVSSVVALSGCICVYLIEIWISHRGGGSFDITLWGILWTCEWIDCGIYDHSGIYYYSCDATGISRCSISDDKRKIYHVL